MKREEAFELLEKGSMIRKKKWRGVRNGRGDLVLFLDKPQPRFRFANGRIYRDCDIDRNGVYDDEDDWEVVNE